MKEYLPITVIVAVILFLFKEALEIKRRIKADKRKVNAYKKIIGRECEKLAWVLQTYGYAFDSATPKQRDGKITEMRVRERPSGVHEITVVEHGETFSEVQTVLPVEKWDASSFNKIMTEVAPLDDKLYEAIVSAYDRMEDVTLYKNMVINGEVLGNEWPLQSRIETLHPESITREKLARDALISLYKICTGKEELKPRIV